jgi:plastocyanin
MTRLLAIALFAALALPAGAASTATVTVKNIDFSKRVVRIHRGDTVRWLFRDAPTPHNVTSRGRPRFASSTSRQSGTYSVRFTKAGTYRYVCTIHPNMAGRVVVS